jgi:hypothetical protein
MPTAPDHDIDAPTTRALVASRPVFVDPSGRRRRVLRLLAIVTSGLVVGYGLLLATAMLGGSPLPTALLPHPAAPWTGSPSDPTVPAGTPATAARSIGRPPDAAPPDRQVAARPAPAVAPASAPSTTSGPAPRTSWTPPGQVDKTRPTGPPATHGP